MKTPDEDCESKRGGDCPPRPSRPEEARRSPTGPHVSMEDQGNTGTPPRRDVQVMRVEMFRGDERLDPEDARDKELIENPMYDVDSRSNYSERYVVGPGDRSQPHRQALSRTLSRTDTIKRYVRRSTAAFFGLDEEREEEQMARWMDRRKRLASKAYGELKSEHYGASSRRSSAYVPTVPQVHDPYMRPHHHPQLPPAPLPVDVTDFATVPRRRKESVAKLTWDGISYLATLATRRRSRPPREPRATSRSYLPSSVTADAEYDEPDYPSSTKARYEHQDSLVDEVFFDVKGGSPEAVDAARVHPPLEFQSTRDVFSVPRPTHDETRLPYRDRSSWQRPPTERQPTDAGGPRVGLGRIWHRMLDRAFDNSNRRQYGMGVTGKIFNRSLRRSVVTTSEVRDQLDDLEDHRPYFTYWVTTVQILILIISLAVYGFGPIGIEVKQHSGLVLVNSLSVQHVDYWEPSSIWLGPRAADLVHLGAKFTPCMRKDEKIFGTIEKQRKEERNTACCIRNDDSGCVQTPRSECSKILATWKKWTIFQPDGRLSGSVCGLDPNYCEEPASVAPFEWPDDITKWPICRRRNKAPGGVETAEHMLCEVIGRPCCIGIHGRCEIRTREYCNFVKGFFHEEASLCSQVSCLDDVCGMMPFYDPDTPDQFYRLWTSLFLHAGLVHLVITVVIQFLFLRDLEKMAGALRIGTIYIVSGIAGNLASAIFVPYRAEVGPAGSQFGLLACLLVEVINVWPLLRRPWLALAKLLGIALLLFIMGLLPWVDNYAHVFGFIVGFLLSYALLPFVSFGPYDRGRKVVLIWVCLVTVLLLLTFLIILLYVTPFYECEVCEYLNCIPFTRDFCAEQDINFNKRTDVT